MLRINFGSSPSQDRKSTWGVTYAPSQSGQLMSWGQWRAQPQQQQYSSSGWGGSAGPQQARVWSCKVCKSSNHSKKTCATCGCKRTWSDVVAGPPAAGAQRVERPNAGTMDPPRPAATAAATQGQSTREQLNVIMAKLEEATLAAGHQPEVEKTPAPPSDAKEVQAQI